MDKQDKKKALLCEYEGIDQDKAPGDSRSTALNAGMLRKETVEWVGSLTGLLGAGLLATNSVWSGYGFVAFLFSNMCWIAYGRMAQARGLITMQVGFTVTSLVGIWQWLG